MEVRAEKEEEITDEKQLKIAKVATNACNLNNEILSALLIVSVDEKDLYENLLDALDNVRTLLSAIDIYNINLEDDM